MFPTEIQMKVLREERARELEQAALDQRARSHNDQPGLWARLRERFSAPCRSESHAGRHLQRADHGQLTTTEQPPTEKPGARPGF